MVLMDVTYHYSKYYDVCIQVTVVRRRIGHRTRLTFFFSDNRRKNSIIRASLHLTYLTCNPILLQGPRTDTTTRTRNEDGTHGTRPDWYEIDSNVFMRPLSRNKSRGLRCRTESQNPNIVFYELFCNYELMSKQPLERFYR